jgi:hypothetical protein
MKSATTAFDRPESRVNDLGGENAKQEVPS